MTYQTHTDVPIHRLDDLLNTLAKTGWRQYTILPSGTNFVVIMQIEAKVNFSEVPF